MKALNEMGFDNTGELMEMMDENDKQMEDMEKPWEQKLKEESERQEMESGLKVKEERNMPHLTNLNEDVQLTGKVYYGLMDCKQYQLD